MRKTKNKRNRKWIMLPVALLLACAVITGVAYARYTTSGNAGDAARVAKWGVTVTATGADAFKTEYDGAVGAESNTVVAAGTVETPDSRDKVVAPGTDGSLGGIAITGTPEVAVTVTIGCALTLTGWAIDGDTYYCPLVITVDGTKYFGGNYENAAAFETAVEAAVAQSETRYEANTDLSGIETLSATITWAWLYQVGTDSTATEGGVSQDDVKDTKLGNLETAPEIEFAVTATVTQVD